MVGKLGRANSNRNSNSNSNSNRNRRDRRNSNRINRPNRRNTRRPNTRRIRKKTSDRRTRRNSRMNRRIDDRRNRSNRRIDRRGNGDDKLSNDNKYIKYDLFNGLKWDNYRLGDVIFGYFACWDNICLNKNNKKLDGLCDFDFDVYDGWCEDYKTVWTDPKDIDASYIKNIHKNFPGSIASKYVKAVGFPKNYKVRDTKTIKKIFDNFKYKKPDSSALVIHLRLGDTMAKEYSDEYSFGLEYYEKLLTKIKKNKKIKKIDIITGLHINVYVKESNDRLNEIVNMFGKHYPVEVILTKNPDKDYYYMANSRFFARSGGGFSGLVVDYLKQDKKNKIYE